jgi:hypothetical protein
MIERDVAAYEHHLRAMAKLSGLFSQSNVPYIDSRFVERLFVVTTNAIDLGRADKSFDAQLPGGIGVGIKTFVAPSGSHKLEKVAEFTALAREGHFRTSDMKKLVYRVGEARNVRVLSNVRELGLDLERCAYHCLVRFEGGAAVHEEPYRIVDLENLSPLDPNGEPIDDWSFPRGKVNFTDGKSRYSYSVAKNVLMKRFEFDRNANVIPLDIHPDPLSLLEQLVGRKPSPASTTTRVMIPPQRGTHGAIPGTDYVVLPLYSTSDGEVQEKSGINQWNAGGRPRKFGEAYVPVPIQIHDRFPAFFPPRDTHFTLRFPNGFMSQRAKICQAGGKALMTQRNVELGRWLVSVIDPTVPSSAFDAPPGPQRRPFSRRDLVAIGSDAVLVRKEREAGSSVYSIEFAPLGSYEEFEAEL